MVLRGLCLHLAATQTFQAGLQCCHCSLPGGATGAGAGSQVGHCGGGLSCCCSRLVGTSAATGQGCCVNIFSKWSCFTTCPRLATYSAISLFSLSTFLIFQQEVEFILRWLVDSGDAESFLLFLVLFTLLSFPFTWGYILVNMAAGYRFGPLFGTLVVIVCVAIGSGLAFLVCRTLLSAWISKYVQNPHLQMIVKVVEGDHGFQVIALTRLTPIPFGLQNGVFALSKVPVSTFMLASFIGLVPTQFLNSYMGSSLRSVQDIRNQHSSSLFLIAQVFLSFLLSAYVLRVAQRELNRKLDRHHHCSLATEDPLGSISSLGTKTTENLILDDKVVQVQSASNNNTLNEIIDLHQTSSTSITTAGEIFIV